MHKAYAGCASENRKMFWGVISHQYSILVDAWANTKLKFLRKIPRIKYFMAAQSCRSVVSHFGLRTLYRLKGRWIQLTQPLQASKRIHWLDPLLAPTYRWLIVLKKLGLMTLILKLKSLEPEPVLIRKVQTFLEPQIVSWCRFFDSSLD